jgi:hypothetical protein
VRIRDADTAATGYSARHVATDSKGDAMRSRIVALALAVAAVAAACGGGAATTAAPAGGGGAAPSAVSPVCANVASLKVVVEKLAAVKPADGAVAMKLAANSVATQVATFVSAAPGDLRTAAQGMKTAIEGVRGAIAKPGAKVDDPAVTAAVAGVTAAWQELLVKLQAACPS